MNEPSESLQGLRVLLTRPALQSVDTAAAIEAAGGQIIALPLLRIDPLEDTASVQAIKSRVMELDRYAIAMFVSSNAARIGMDWIDRYWPQLPRDLQACTVGPGTAAVLEEFTWPVFFPAEGVTSEALLAMPQMQEVAGQKILLFRGRGGRELLAKSLRERGADVDYVELYERRVPDYSSSELHEALIEREPEVLVVTSQQSLDALEEMLHDSEEMSTIRQRPLMVPSARVAEQARAAGYSRVHDAGGAGDEDILRCLFRIRREMAP